jgi:hypothetical protein
LENEEDKQKANADTILVAGWINLNPLFSMSRDLIEKHYSQGLYHLLARALGYISQCLPLSLARYWYQWQYWIAWGADKAGPEYQ